MVNNNKWGFGVIVSLIVISLGIFLLVFYKNVTIEPQTVYTVYLDGRSIGNIVSKKSFEDYINVKEEELKNILLEFIDLDYKSKNGMIDINVGLESVLCRYCS